ncbi:hypothetical protein U1Q18_023453 [Sarracenia purpurea var. burkii]
MESKPPINVPPPRSGGVDPKNSRNASSPARAEATGPSGEGSPSIRLGLGMGAGSGGSSGHATTQPFTAAQLYEFQEQYLILKYIAAGLPVPCHLLLPVWDSVAWSIGSSNGGIYNQFPSFIGFSPQGFDYRTMMDPEPERCRRTDGKKWRCSRDVVPNQKYCERHVHRGRQRSRKHVEEASVIPSESGRTFESIYTQKTINSVVTANPMTNPSTSIPINLQLATPSLNTSGTTPAATTPTTTTTTITCISTSNNGRDDNNVAAKKYSAATTYNSNTGSDKNDYGINSNKVNNCKVSSFVAPGFGLSTKTVLRGWNSSCDDYGNTVDSKLQRCRRTDGRKWKCGRNAVPNHKYCGRHLHRGMKKLTVPATSQSVTVAAAAPLAGSVFLAPPLAIPKKENGHINLNTNLSISIAPSPRQMSGEEEASPDDGGGGGSSSSSSDATTITDDENGSFSHFLDIS